MTSPRLATLSDIELVRALINSAEAACDPKAKPVGSLEVQEHIEGVFEEVSPWLWVNEAGIAEAFVTVQVDSARERQLADCFVHPESRLQAAVIERVIETAGAHRDWDLWMSCNAKDESMRAAFLAAGFETLRTYWSLEAAIDNPALALPAGVEIRRVVDDEDLKVAHAVQQESFADHFGFAPRAQQEWIDLTKSAPSFDPNGIAVIFVEGIAAGYIECVDEHAHRGSGYVHGLGVRPNFRRRGLGKLLLEWAKDYCRDRGFATIELNVDAANPTGALHLYESAGFSPYASWEQWHHPRWQALSKAL